MADYPDRYQYTAEHEWVSVDDDIGTIGITHHAQEELGDVVFVELPEVGASFEQNARFGTIEAVKAVCDLYAPVSGEVVEVNKTIEDHLQVLARDPWDKGWLIRVKPDDTSTSHLLDAEGYEASLGEADA